MTTIAFEGGVLAADQCHTLYDTEAGDEPTSRVYANKIRLVGIGAFHRIAIATRGDSIDGVLIEREISKHIRESIDKGMEPHFAQEFDDWGVDMSKTKWNDPDAASDGIILYRDIRHEHTICAWQIDCDPRVIHRIKKGEFAAVGCDAPLALAAMEAGVGAVKAVWIAAKYGTATSGPVNSVNAATMVMSLHRHNPLEP